MRGPIDFGVWGAVIPNLAYTNLAQEVWLEAKLDPYVPARRAHVSGRGSTKRPTNRFCCSRCPDSRVNREQSAQMRERVARGSPQRWSKFDSLASRVFGLPKQECLLQ